jgi:Skp family chaperone for outer membrane proteins
MVDKAFEIECPECGAKISVNDALRGDIESEIEKRYQKKLKKAQDDYSAKEEDLAKEKAQLEKQKERIWKAQRPWPSKGDREASWARPSEE